MSSESINTKVDLRQKYQNPDTTFDLYLSVDVGSDTKGLPGLNAVTLSSYALKTYLAAVYYQQAQMVEFCISNRLINDWFSKDTQLEFQMAPQTQKGAVVLTISF